MKEFRYVWNNAISKNRLMCTKLLKYKDLVLIQLALKNPCDWDWRDVGRS